MKPEELTDLLAQYYRKKRKNYKRVGRLFISDLEWEGCKLGLWRKLKDFPQTEKKPGELLMFEQGDNLEEQIADDLAQVLTENSYWCLVDRQTSVSITVDDEEITGKLDILMRNYLTGELLVLEVKSKRGKAFQYLDKPKTSNVAQVQGYQKGTGATKGLLVYVDREGQNFLRIFAVTPDDASVVESARKLIALRDGPEPPKIVPTVRENENVGDNSLALIVPWQITWCSDKECPCKRALPKFPDGKVVAKRAKDGAIYSKDYEHLIPLLKELLK